MPVLHFVVILLLVMGKLAKKLGKPYEISGHDNEQETAERGEWDHQITVSRGPECTTACTRGERAAEHTIRNCSRSRHSHILFDRAAFLTK